MSSVTPEMAMLTLQATSAIGDAVNSYGSAKRAQSQARLNAAMADIEASDIEQRGRTEAAAIQGRGQRGTAKVRAQTAASGFTVGAGTAGDLEGVPEFIANLDAATIRENASREALGVRTNAALGRTQADSVSPWG